MATTKIWPAKDSLARVVDYAQNPEKTTYLDLRNVLHYAANEEKTVERTERAMFVTGVNCNRDTAFQEMQAVKERVWPAREKGADRQTQELDKAKQRVTEIDQLIQKSYEDMTKGLSKERFSTLTVSLETEQTQLKAAIPEMEAILDATAADFQRFIERARQVTRLTELTPEIVHEFIEKIVVSKPEKLDGKRHQTVDIHYNTIGLWTEPDPETLEQE